MDRDDTPADDELLADADDDILARPSRPASELHAGRLWWLWVVAAVFVGVAAGSWIANAHLPPATMATSYSGRVTATPTVDPAVRIPELQARIAQAPDDVDARLELGVLLYEQNPPDLAGATEQFRRVVEIDPKNENAWYNLGFCYISMNPPDCASALDAWNTVTRIDPTGDNATQIRSHMMGLMPSVCPSYIGVTPPPTETGR